MKKQIFILLISLISLTGCSKNEKSNTTVVISNTESTTQMEVTTEKETDVATIKPTTETTSAPSSDIQSTSLSEQQALHAIEYYCRIQNPNLNNMSQDEYNYYWEVIDSSDSSYCILFRSYTGAQQYFYIDRETGQVNVTELVPGILNEETPTDETFNIYDYME